jgi:hypothetical protein
LIVPFEKLLLVEPALSIILAERSSVSRSSFAGEKRSRPEALKNLSLLRAQPALQQNTNRAAPFN